MATLATAARPQQVSPVRDRRRPKPQPPARPAWEWTLRPSPRPMGWHAGILAINGTPYLVECTYEQNDEFGTFCVIDLRKPNGDHYRLITDPEGNPSCDCPDAIYRHRECVCKHAVALREACEALTADPTDADFAEFGDWIAEQDRQARVLNGEPVPF